MAKTNDSMTDTQKLNVVLANQESILENQRLILANQDDILEKLNDLNISARDYAEL